VTEEMMRHLAAIGAAFGSLRRDCPTAGAGDLDLFETRFVVGDRPGYRYQVDPLDREENLKSIRQGKQHSDFLIATIHAHEEGAGCAEPGDFLPDLARAAIDAGADAFIAHGVHALGPIEIYKRRPIFYGLANFFWSDMQEPMPATLYEGNRDLLKTAFGDPARATDADLTGLLNASGFDDELVFQTVIAVSRFEKGELVELRLHPVDLGYGMRLTKSGVPRLASPAAGRAILERLARISRPYGTALVIEKDVGVIRPRPD
jgi:poly-gamma-glutamate synthesis protein (capsule biosynthesis protein)